jgi:hypothetical protein
LRSILDDLEASLFMAQDVCSLDASAGGDSEKSTILELIPDESRFGRTIPS